MQVVVSLLVLIAAFLVLFAPNRLLQTQIDESTKRLASGWIGAVIGYWLS